MNYLGWDHSPTLFFVPRSAYCNTQVIFSWNYRKFILIAMINVIRYVNNKFNFLCLMSKASIQVNATKVIEKQIWRSLPKLNSWAHHLKIFYMRFKQWHTGMAFSVQYFNISSWFWIISMFLKATLKISNFLIIWIQFLY